MAMRLAELGPEPWGRRVRRARDAARLTLDQATERINRAYPASRRAIAMLEELDEVPTSGRRPVLAYVALLAYGFEPASFDVPPPESRLLTKRNILRALGDLPWVTDTRPLVEVAA